MTKHHLFLLFVLTLHSVAFPEFSQAQSQSHDRDVTADRRFNAVAWTQNAAEYRLATRQAYRLAALQLDAGLEDAEWTADLVQREHDDYSRKRPAVILDVDETVLDNSAYNARQILQGTGYSTESWNAWVREMKATAVPGALTFVKHANERGVRVFFVTNRRDVVKEATILNLRALGFEANEHNVLTRNDDEGRPRNKVARRAMVAENHRIVLLIGDNMGDFCAGMDTNDGALRNEIAAEKERLVGERWIVLPNPIYGGWESALGEPSEALDPAESDD